MDDITGVAKPLEKLIGSVSKAIGALYEPTHIRRKAKARKDAELIRLEGEFEKNELVRKAVKRIGHIETRRQSNIDRTVAASAEHLPSVVSEDPVNEDWMARFFDGCQDVSEEHMLDIWARILAGEVTKPGSFSGLTLSTLQNMTRHDAEVFERHASLAWSMGDIFFIPVDIADAMPVRSWDETLLHSDTLHMDTLGLLKVHDHLKAYVVYGGVFRYFDQGFVADEKSIGRMNVFSFTRVGEDLLKICNRAPSSKYLESSLAFMSGALGIKLLPLD